MYLTNQSIVDERLIHVEHLYIDPDSGESVLLGYPLVLSALEFKLLKAIALAYPKAVSRDDLCHEHNISQNSLAVHISSINKKAAQISERRLVLFCDGYLLNEFM